MSYKDVIKSRETRTRILRLLDWIPDRIMIPLQYRIKTGRRLDLREPKRFTEKLQWMKLNYRDPLMARCVDKYDVRGYVEERGLGDTLVPLLGVYGNADDVDFSALPERFVLKDTLGGGGNDVVVCAGRADFDEESAREAMRRWTEPGRHRRHPGREWVYDREGSSRIVCEEYLESEDAEHGLVEYKFFCFGGEPRYLYVLSDRELGNGAALGVFEAEGFQRVEAWRADERRLDRSPARPATYDAMLSAARALSGPFPEVRVDFYDLGERGFRFGELTFFDGSGYFAYEPDEFDFEMGDAFELPERRF